MKKKRRLLFLSLLLMAVGANAEPIVRVVSNNGSDKAFATESVRKLVLSADAVNVVNSAGSVLLSVPFAEIARVEFADGTPTPSTPTVVPTAQVREAEAVKVMENGHVYILRSGKKYTIMGVEVMNI
ncbi:MAG: hypothetical protein IJ814_00705 [Paludibacteraceae bacterium]|nr:hypothetical protein [Paludibacteraceae bacterium]